MKIKLETTDQASQSLSETEKAYVVALNHTSQVAFEKKAFNSVALHHVTYRDVREVTKLPANLVCSARNVVAEAYKREKEKRHRWKETAAMRYDARTLRVKLDQQYATLTTLESRTRVKLILSDYHRQYLDGTWEVEPTATVSRNGWPFSSLFLKIAHVASKHGIKLEPVDARNTSRTCHKCGHCESANRKSQSVFLCVRCGHKSNADYNASLNVRDRRVPVTDASP
ncbi:MAG TPA: zinc ribbon domain-containing protein [Blastocatellia bacterium]|nr:zinc ribbon domain-containing protein [Blastocatellia bacterium]